MKKILLLILCMMLTVNIIACGSTEIQKDEPTGEADTDLTKLEKIVISEPTRGILWGPVHLAKELGFFEEQGLDVEIVTIQGDVPTAPVLTGDAQFGLFGPEMIFSLNERGQATKLLITTTKKYPYSFLTREEYPSIETLKGTVINGADGGSSPRQFVRSVLETAGLDPDTDASYVNIPGSGTLAAFRSKDINATYATPEFRKLLLDEGAKLLVDMYNPETHKKILNSETYEMHITFARDDYIEQNPEIVQKYVNAVYKAILWTNEHSAEEITEAIRPSFSTNKNLGNIIKEIRENDIYSNTGDFSETGFNAINKVAKEAGLIENYLKREQVIDDSFLKKAQENIN